MLKKIIGNQEKKFIINAIAVWGLSQIVLHVLLIIFNVFVATFASQIIYTIIGYVFYGKNVFNIRKHNNSLFLKFLIVAIFLLIVNYNGINLLNLIINNKNISAIIMIPILASFSFLLQKYFVFK
tara:strand:- start:720 stop:1094 length:375 start_codon:yes stop_codon:yes gene_type:complete